MARYPYFVCTECGGDGGWHVPVGMDTRDGNLIERWQECTACEGKGEVEIEDDEPLGDEEMI